MYHRNKVHTDEFWRYELTKNRRTVMDDKANEDLWKKQLGKHAEETARQKLEAENAAAAALAALGNAANAVKADTENKSVTNEHETGGEEVKWLEQINRNTAQAGDDANVSTEMKLLALQSLQNSLRFMSMGMVGSNLQTMAPIKVEPNVTSPSASGSGQSQQPQESYLNLLAQLAKRESEERMNKRAPPLPPSCEIKIE